MAAGNTERLEREKGTGNGPFLLLWAEKKRKGRRMPAITSANVANAIVKLVAADALPALVGNLVLGNLVNRDYEPTLAQTGDTINIPQAPALVANNIAEGGT